MDFVTALEGDLVTELVVDTEDVDVNWVNLLTGDLLTVFSELQKGFGGLFGEDDDFE